MNSNEEIQNVGGFISNRIFANSEFGNVEVIINGSELLFNANHVARVLGIKKVRNTTKDWDRIDKWVLKDSDAHNMGIKRKFNNKGETFLTESGLYRIMFLSRKPNAEKFRKWITSEVIPDIRKHGMYLTDQTVERFFDNPELMLSMVQKYVEIKKRNKELEERQKLLTHSGKLYTTSELAKELGIKSAERLNKFLAALNVQFKRNGTWLPSAEIADKGYTETKQTILPDGRVIYFTMWTQKGREFILELFKEKQFEIEMVNRVSIRNPHENIANYLDDNKSI